MRKNRNIGGSNFVNVKYCKGCKKEYSETENFNWSCIVHRGEWGGDIWWCCGKTHKGAIGCKYQKHQSKEEAEELEEAKKEATNSLKMTCCVNNLYNNIHIVLQENRAQ